jgi:glycosyltransferase involved in cell wall biosynthesis
MRISVVTPTHDPKYIPELWRSLKRQTFADWDWVLAPSELSIDAAVRASSNPWVQSELLRITSHERVRCRPYLGPLGNIGAAKLWAFSHAEGDVLVEVDHDDLLAPNALAEVARAFEDPGIGFAYSDCVDWSPSGEAVTYHDPARRAAWAAEGWQFAEVDVPWPFDKPNRQEKVTIPVSFEPGALMVSTIFRAPNHLRAWRRSIYRELGGHDPTLKVCDDAELMIRTYLRTRMKRIPEVLYAYRVDGANTWLGKVEAIRMKTFELQGEHLHALVAREMSLRGLPCLDLGGAINSPGIPWMPVDMSVDGIDLTKPWPFPDSSVGAFRAFDFLEHLPDKLHSMREIYRCLAPGGWLLSLTPSAAGPGAYRDPTHVSFWVSDGFRYHTERELARYLPADPSGRENPRFMAVRLHESGDLLPYITADLVSLKNDDGSLPGPRRI